MDDLIPLTNHRFPNRYDIYLSSAKIRIGTKISNPLKHFSNYLFPPPLNYYKTQETLSSFSPNLQRLITKDWFISLKSFAFQWNVHTFGDKKTLSILAKIFEHASQLPNLRTFAWIIDCTCHPPKESESDEESTHKPQENELPISKDVITSNLNLFPRVESMKLSFYEENEIFVSIPLFFFESYFSNTRSLSELQIEGMCKRLSLSLLSLLLTQARK